MKTLFNFYLFTHFLDLALIAVLYASLQVFNIGHLFGVKDEPSLYSSLIGLSSTILSLGAMCATLLVSITPNEIFARMLKELGDKLLKNIFYSLAIIFFSVLLYVSLSFDLINTNIISKQAVFLSATMFLISNTLRFGIILYRILKIRVG